MSNIYICDNSICSGKGAYFAEEERQMLNVWLNYTLVSCLSNVSKHFKHPVLDSIVFWYCLDVDKLEILLKQQNCSGDDFWGKNKIEPHVYEQKARALMQLERQESDLQEIRNNTPRNIDKLILQHAFSSQNDMLAFGNANDNLNDSHNISCN